MHARISKEEIALQMPESLSHYFKDEPGYMSVPTQTGLNFFGKVAAVLRWVAEMPRRRSVIDELSALSDHELSDIGLSRADLNQVFDPAFAAQRSAERETLNATRRSAITA